MNTSNLVAIYFILSSFCIMNCTSKPPQKMDMAFEIIDEEAHKLFSAEAQLEVLDSGFVWTEGPLWLPEQKILLFNDIPANKTYSWSEASGTEVYLDPSGYTHEDAREGEPGANGLLLNTNNQLLLCQHGNRQIALMDAPLDKPSSNFETVVGSFKGKQFSSPNDATISKSGNIYFTDPPYGLAHPDLQETDFNGVYRYSKEGELTLLDSTLTRPNGVAFTPDEKYLIVANSDPQQATWTKYTIDEASGEVSKKEVLYDATQNATSEKGLPDGLKINDDGYVFATGPGGIWVFNPNGKVLAKIRTGQATSNCAFGPNQNTLYITADDYLMRAVFK